MTQADKRLLMLRFNGWCERCREVYITPKPGKQHTMDKDVVRPMSPTATQNEEYEVEYYVPLAKADVFTREERRWLIRMGYMRIDQKTGWVVLLKDVCKAIKMGK